MIILSTVQPFARGGRRECFVHPADSTRCIKVPRFDFLPERMKRDAPWLRSVRKSVDDFDENVADWKVLNALDSLADATLWLHIPRCFGWVQTDRGRGLVVELLRDPDGRISRTLLDWLWERGYDATIKSAVDELAEFWEARTIPSRSLGLHNIVAQRKADGSMRLLVIDGLGSTEFFPFSRWSRAYALRRSRSKIAGMRRDIAGLLERKAGNLGPGSRGFLLP